MVDVYIHTMSIYGIKKLRNLVLVAMVTTLPLQQKLLQVLFCSLHPSTKS